MNSVVGTELNVLQRTVLDPFHSIAAYPVKGRPTIVLLIVHNDHVLFVRAANGCTWMLPQGGIEHHDGTLLGAAIREGFEELGLKEQYMLRFNQTVLGECVNPIASERCVEYVNKHLFFILLPVKNHHWVTLNYENIEYAWVSSYGQLLSMRSALQKVMTVKFQATCEAIDEVFRRGLLSWSCTQ